MQHVFQQQHENLLSSYHKYREYYDRKARAQPQPLRPKRYCSLLHPLLNTKSEKIKGLQCKFQLLYRVEGALTDSNYLIRKVGTNHTQIAHCTRLRPIKPQHQINDLEIIDPKNFSCDPSIEKDAEEPELLDQQIDRLGFFFFARMPQADQTPTVTFQLPFPRRREAEQLPSAQPTNENSPILTPSTSFSSPSRRTSLPNSTTLSSPTVSRPQTPIDTNYNLEESRLFTPPTASTPQLTQGNITASPNVSPTQTENSEVFIGENQGPIRPPFTQPEVIRVPEHQGSRINHQNSPGQPFTDTQPTLQQSPMFAPFTLGHFWWDHRPA